MTPRCNRTYSFATAAALAMTSATAQSVLINDNFEVDTSANYLYVDDGTPDGTQTFAFDYVAAGIPLAPRSAAGTSKGLKLTANDTGLGVSDAFTLFHNTLIVEPQYTLTVDVWMNFVGVTATTEHAHVGVGGDGVTFNSLFTPISGSGAFIAFDGDGGSISDYRWFRHPANTPPGETSNTTLPNDHPSYLGHSSNNTGSFFQSLFPSPPSTIAGSPGNIWTTVRIEVDNINGQISFYFDGQLTFQGDFANTFDGFASLGMADVFASVSPATNFTLYDNFVVDTASTSTLGMNYCTAIVNSTGSASGITASGSVSVANNNVTLLASAMPMNSFGFFLTSLQQGMVSMPGGSQGNLCLGGAIGRYVGPGQVQNSGAGGQISLLIDLTQHPQPTGLVAVAPGETWHFTTWFRDALGGVATSNFSNGLTLVFQ